MNQGDGRIGSPVRGFGAGPGPGPDSGGSKVAAAIAETSDEMCSKVLFLDRKRAYGRAHNMTRPLKAFLCHHRMVAHYRSVIFDFP